MKLNGNVELRHIATPVSATANYAKFYAKTWNKLAMMQSDNIEQNIVLSGYWELYENSTTWTAIALTASWTAYWWITATAGLSNLVAFTDNATADRLTVQAWWDGVYKVTFDQTCSLSGGGTSFRAWLWLNWALTNISSYRVWTLANLPVAFSWLITLAAWDYLDVRFSCGANNRTLSVYSTRLTINRVFR
jgi:hypothetical protein